MEPVVAGYGDSLTSLILKPLNLPTFGSNNVFRDMSEAFCFFLTSRFNRAFPAQAQTTLDGQRESCGTEIKVSFNFVSLTRTCCPILIVNSSPNTTSLG